MCMCLSVCVCLCVCVCVYVSECVFSIHLMYRLVTSQFKVGLAVSVIGYISVMLVVAEVALCALASSTLDHFAGSVSQTLAALVTKLHTYYRV